jgi:membrane protease YdiL (CAAX protease family)
MIPSSHERHTPAARIRGLVAVSLACATLAMLWSVLELPFLSMPTWAAPFWVLAVVAAFGWWYALRGEGFPRLRRRVRYGLRGPRGAVHWITAFNVSAVALNLSFGLLLAAVGWIVDREEANPFLLYAKRPGGWVTLALSMAVAAPVIEEVLFRGRLQGALQRRMGATLSIVLTAAVFALAHLEANGMLVRFLAGVTMGFAFRATGSVWAGMVQHGAFNGSLLLIDALFPNLDPTQPHFAAPAACALAIAAGATLWTGRALHASARRRASPASTPAARAAAAPLPVPG